MVPNKLNNGNIIYYLIIYQYSNSGDGFTGRNLSEMLNLPVVVVVVGTPNPVKPVPVVPPVPKPVKPDAAVDSVVAVPKPPNVGAEVATPKPVKPAGADVVGFVVPKILGCVVPKENAIFVIKENLITLMSF